MKILHVTDDLQTIKGGVPSAINQLSENLIKKNLDVLILHTSKSNYEIPHGVIDLSCPPSGILKFWHNSNFLRETMKGVIEENLNENLIIHIHGLWNAPQFFAAFYASKSNIPFVITFHGMIENWLWVKQGIIKRFKKNLYWYCILKKYFLKASAMHAITNNEKCTIKNLINIDMQIEIIPNTVAKISYHNENIKHKPLKKDILFLGRIDRVKGVDILAKAFMQANISKEWRLIIAGPVSDEAYKKEIDKIIKHECSERIVFTGPVFKGEKANLLQSSWVLAAPSHTEMMGLVNLEAALHKLPSITTYNTGLHDWEEGGGILSEPDVRGFKKIIEEVTQWTEDKRLQRGILSANHVNKKYTNEHGLNRWLSLYNKLLP
jgi:glycosyltransferase involved in cell wall biosynthesis